MGAINKEKLKKIKNIPLEGSPTKCCPICGGFPELIENDLGAYYDGYPGDFNYKCKCSKCGIIETEEHSTLYEPGNKNERRNNAKKKIANEWNETVDLINDLITKTRAEFSEEKTFITGTARLSTEPPVTYTICPYCKGHHTEQLYGTAILSTEKNDFCSHYRCLDCGKEFDMKF